MNNGLSNRFEIRFKVFWGIRG